MNTIITWIVILVVVYYLISKIRTNKYIVDEDYFLAPNPQEELDKYLHKDFYKIAKKWQSAAKNSINFNFMNDSPLKKYVEDLSKYCSVKAEARRIVKNTLLAIDVATGYSSPYLPPSIKKIVVLTQRDNEVCESCAAFDGIVYKIIDIRQISAKVLNSSFSSDYLGPMKNCRNKKGCRCGHLPVKLEEH